MLRTNLQDQDVVWESRRLNHSLLSQDWEKAEWPHWMLNSIIWDTVTQILIMFTDHTLCHRIIIRHTLLSTHIQAIQVACGIIEHFAIIETILPKFDATLIIISSICIHLGSQSVPNRITTSFYGSFKIAWSTYQPLSKWGIV